MAAAGRDPGPAGGTREMNYMRLIRNPVSLRAAFGGLALTACAPGDPGSRGGPGSLLAAADRPPVCSVPAPQDFLQGDCTKAKQKLSWKPRVAFDVSASPGRSGPGPGRGRGG